MSLVARKPVFGVSNLVGHKQKMATGLKFRIEEVEGLYYLCSENKGTDLHLCFHISKR